MLSPGWNPPPTSAPIIIIVAQSYSLQQKYADKLRLILNFSIIINL